MVLMDATVLQCNALHSDVLILLHQMDKEGTETIPKDPGFASEMGMDQQPKKPFKTRNNRISKDTKLSGVSLVSKSAFAPGVQKSMAC
jgi:hypothetical protein